jgi:hypothetical protein
VGSFDNAEKVIGTPSSASIVEASWLALADSTAY